MLGGSLILFITSSPGVFFYSENLKKWNPGSEPFLKIQNEITTGSWFLKHFKELAVGPVTCQTDSLPVISRHLLVLWNISKKIIKELVKEPTLNASSLIFFTPVVLCPNRIFWYFESCGSRVHIPDPYPPISSFFEKERTLIAQEWEKSYTYLYIPITVGTYK
jgi:hypothetical protein